MDWTIQFDEAVSRYLPDLKVVCDEPMSRHTTFRIGGPAKRMAYPSSREQLVLLLNFAEKSGADPLVIGNGSNLLAPDEGLNRLVIDTSAHLNRVEQTAEHIIRADAGATLARTADLACKLGLTGLEFAHGIPGTVGGGVCMNAGAYGGEMKQVLRSASVLFPEAGVRTLTCEELELGYRTSCIPKKNYIVLEAVFELNKGSKEAISSQMRELAGKRREKQPLEYASAGSTFKRPEGYFAAKLIEDAGLKGFSVGGAMVSEKHSGFVINYNDATASDVMELCRQVREKVKALSGVELEMEVKRLGEFK